MQSRKCIWSKYQETQIIDINILALGDGPNRINSRIKFNNLLTKLPHLHTSTSLNKTHPTGSHRNFKHFKKQLQHMLCFPSVYNRSRVFFMTWKHPSNYLWLTRNSWSIKGMNILWENTCEKVRELEWHFWRLAWVATNKDPPQ